MFILPNLNVATAIGRVLLGEQVEEVFVVNFYEGALDGEIPSTGSFVAEFPCAGEYCGHGSRDDAHTVLGISGVCLEVDTGHCMRFSGAGLTIGEDGAVEALQKPRNERIRSGGKDGMLGGRRTVDLIKRELLLPCGDGLGAGRS